MFLELREYGKTAEKAMFEATSQVNTHKGAIFSLGDYDLCDGLFRTTAYGCTRCNKADAIRINKT